MPPKTNKITWKLEKRKLKDLKEWSGNPRLMTDAQSDDLANSINRFGFAEPLIINTDNQIIGGHMRRKTLIQKMGVSSDVEVPVMVPSRALDKREAEEFAIRLNKNTGYFDFEVLANEYDMDELQEWGFVPRDFGIDEEVKAKGAKEGKKEGKRCPTCKRPL